MNFCAGMFSDFTLISTPSVGLELTTPVSRVTHSLGCVSPAPHGGIFLNFQTFPALTPEGGRCQPETWGRGPDSNQSHDSSSRGQNGTSSLGHALTSPAVRDPERCP